MGAMGHAGQHRCVHRKYGTSRRVKKTVVGKKTTSLPKLKPSLVPGAVVIMLTGEHRAKRGVFIKQLKCGDIMVAGPYAVNKVPYVRINQKEVIGTSLKLDLKGASYDSITDEYFKKPNNWKKNKKKNARKDETAFFAAEDDKEKKGLTE